MALTHLVGIVYRPGIKNIAVQYQVADSGIWITWKPGQRIIQGATVRFTVETYENFTLTEWDALYADEYDDTGYLELTGIPGQSAWEFTMPSADVYIRCEASGGGSPTFVYPEHSTGSKNIKYFATYDEAIEAYLNKLGFTNNDSDLLVNAIKDGQYSGRVAAISAEGFTDTYGTLVVYLPDISRENVPVTMSFPTSNLSCYFYGGYYEIRNGVFTCYRRVGPTSARRSLAYGYLEGGSTTIAGTADEPTSSDAISIRYIMSPENLGEIDASAPTQLEQGTTEFTFKWRIKSGYTFKRLTPFAIGDPPLEDDVVYSSSYDGETRTYTVTVQQIPDWAKGVRVLIECINENEPNVGGNSGIGGGDGTFDETSDSIPLESMPSISAADAGLVTLFRPTLAELKQLGAYLWTNVTDFIENLQKIFSNPMDVIIALNILPGLPPVNTARTIRLGLWETNITMSPVKSQWYEIDFGSIRIAEFWGSALDYAPNTKIHAMLPFIGAVPLNTDDVMGKTLGLIYRIDLLSGHLVAVMTVNDDALYQFTGECAVSVPLTGADWSRVYGAIAGTLGVVAAGVAGAAAAGAVGAGLSQNAALAVSAAAKADFDYMAGAISGLEHRQLQAAAATAIGRKSAADSARAASFALASSNTVNQIMSGKLQVAHSGNISGSAGLLGTRTPYIYIEYPNQSMAENYKHFYGYPSNMYANLGDLEGFTQCYQVLLDGVNGTDGEVAEILQLLKEGVYL